jgi:hypothetical protein
VAFAAAPPASMTRPSHTLAAELLTTAALPATTVKSAITQPKIPEASGD